MRRAASGPLTGWLNVGKAWGWVRLCAKDCGQHRSWTADRNMQFWGHSWCVLPLRIAGDSSIAGEQVGPLWEAEGQVTEDE